MLSKGSITREQATEKARNLARTEYDNVDDFEAKVQDDPSHWKIDFTNPRALARGESHHFSVWIDKATGEARLFKGR